jgi:hypothetical protein
LWNARLGAAGEPRELPPSPARPCGSWRTSWSGPNRSSGAFGGGRFRGSCAPKTILAARARSCVRAFAACLDRADQVFEKKAGCARVAGGLVSNQRAAAYTPATGSRAGRGRSGSSPCGTFLVAALSQHSRRSRSHRRSRDRLWPRAKDWRLAFPAGSALPTPSPLATGDILSGSRFPTSAEAGEGAAVAVQHGSGGGRVERLGTRDWSNQEKLGIGSW